jgi:hypothetical protein
MSSWLGRHGAVPVLVVAAGIGGDLFVEDDDAGDLAGIGVDEDLDGDGIGDADRAWSALSVLVRTRRGGGR